MADAYGDSVRTMVGPGVTSRLAYACRRAWRDGRAVVSNRDLLAAVIHRAVSPPRGALLTVVDATPEPDVVEPAGPPVEFEIAMALREATWMTRRRLRRPADATAPLWSEPVVATIRRAVTEAQQAGEETATLWHLAATLHDDAGRDLTAMLAAAGMSPERLITEPPTRQPDGPKPPLPEAGGLLFTGWLDLSHDRLLRALLFPLTVFAPLNVRRQPVCEVLEWQAILQAVWCGHPQASELHLLVAITSLERSLRLSDLRFGERYATVNRAGAVLERCGVTYPDIAEVVSMRPLEATVSDTSTKLRRYPYNPPVSRDLASTVEAAVSLARQQRLRYAGTDHLVLALTADQDRPVPRLLTDVGVDVEAVRGALVAQPADLRRAAARRPRWPSR